MKILIVEDHADIRSLIRMTLEFERATIHEVANASAAIHAAALLKPDLVLMDVMMPGPLNGLDACRAMRADPVNQGMGIVLLSARAQSRDIENGLAAGADAYLLKPFSPLKLLGAVNRWARRAGCAAAS